MSYISTYRYKDNVTIWERKDGQRIQKSFKAPYYFYSENKNGSYTSIYGDKLDKQEFESGAEFNIAKKQSKNFGRKLFESDIPPELKILSDEYYNLPAPDLHISLYDIEVDYDLVRGYSSIEDPYAPVNSIALYHVWSKEMFVIAVPPTEYKGTTDPDEILKKMDNIAPLMEDINVEVLICKDEKELLQVFLHLIEDTDLISGWNSSFFDDPYVAKRLEMYGKTMFRKFCFPGAKPPTFREVETAYRVNTTVDLSGRVNLDYLELFRKYEMAERQSYKLESIAEEFCSDLPKLEYQGTLATLYKTDFLWFIRYNLRDTEILKRFEDILGYVDLANQMVHLSTGEFKHVMGTLKLAELATINFCHKDLDLIVNDNDIDEENGGQIQGAFVLLPQVGLHEYIGSVDINSLYPSAIRSINISPETLRGQFCEKVNACKEIAKKSDAMLTFEVETTGEEITLSAREWSENLWKLKWAVSGYGTVFDQAQKGIIPSILEDWYATRKKFQKMKGEAKAAGDKVKAGYYDKLQYVYKIKLNSFYGALTNQYFRFYDLRMGESTTGTGRMILLHQGAKTVEILDGEYVMPDRKELDDNGKTHIGYTDKYSVVYGDTDSNYFVTGADNIEDAIFIADNVGELVNKSFKEYMKTTFICQPGFDDIIKTGREIVSDRGIFVDKKRYMLHIVDDEGEKIDKLKVMGLDTKKTTLPKQISKTINSYLNRFLKGEDWDNIENDIVEYKEMLDNTDDLTLIGLPKGINKVEIYTQEYNNDLKINFKTRLPGHIAAGIHWNLCRKKYKDNISLEITSGMKIRIFYLTQSFGRFISIAIPVDGDVIPDWFMENFYPIINRKAHTMRLIDAPLNNIIKALGKKAPSKQSLFVKTILEF